MKTLLRLNLYSAILMLIFLPSLNSSAQGYEKHETIVKSYPAKSSCNVSVSNKYGNVHITPWDKDSVKFIIRYSVRATKASKVEKMFNEINFSFTGTPYFVMGRTIISKSAMGSAWSDLTSFLSAENRVEINYEVYMPKNANLKMDNKFGNVYTTDHNGSVEINVSNGDLRAGKLNNDSRLKVEFSNYSKVEFIKNGKLELNYSDFELTEGNKIHITSKSSTIYTGDIVSLQIDSKRDKMYLGKVSSVKGASQFSLIKPKVLEKELTLNTSYGEIYLENLGGNVNLVNINSKFTDIQIHFKNNQGCSLDLSYNPKTILTLPEGSEKLNKKLTDPEKEIFRLSGQLGNPKIPLFINTDGGSVKIYMK